MARLLLLLLVAGCAAPVEAPVSSDSLVMSQLLFSRQDDGVSDGFDLDGEVSEQGDDAGCGHGDFTGLDGTPGVDNAGARLIVLLEQTEAVATEALIQQQINNGAVMIVLTLEGLDDRVNDDSVDVILERAAGAPFVGNDGWIEPGQTLELSDEIAPIRIDGNSISVRLLGNWRTWHFSNAFVKLVPAPVAGAVASAAPAAGS